MEAHVKDTGECAVCRKKATLKCGNCKVEFYCGKNHQRVDWSRHKTICLPWEVCESTELGRYLSATRDIAKDDVLISEMPLVWGPAPYHLSDDLHFSQQVRACVGCGKRFDNSVEPQRCPLCIWPACSSMCEGLTDRNKHAFECPYLRRYRITPRSDILLVFRILIHWQMKSRQWESLSKLQSHVESRGEGTDAYEETLFVARWLSSFTAAEPAAADVIPKICGLIDINAIEVGGSPYGSFGIYEKSSLLEHSCISNTRYNFMNDNKGKPRIIVRACRNIKKGEHLTTTYTHVLWATKARQEHLLSSKYFMCNCERCADPTELGTHIGTIKCACKNGLVLPKDPLDPETCWTCNACPMVLTGFNVAELTKNFSEHVEEAMKIPKVDELCTLLDRLMVFLHPGHQHCISVAHSLIQLLPADDPRKPELCQRILKSTAALDPYGTRLALYTVVALRELSTCPGQDKKELLSKALSLLKYEKSGPTGVAFEDFLKSELCSL